MPELKRNFLRGKMNKDLDERLVPDGEYRDALNIEISTSEESNVGSAQTLRGNKSVSSFTHGNNNVASISVGQYTDEENEYIYNFVHKVRSVYSDTNYANYTSGDKPRIIGFNTDAILRYKKDPLTESVETEVVFSDVYEARVANGVIGPNNKIVGLSNLSWNRKVNGVNITSNVATSIKPGMRVQAVDVNGVDLWGNNDVRVISVQSNLSGENHIVEITPVLGYAQGYAVQEEHYGNNMIADGVVLRFTSDRILNFKPGTTEVESNNKLADGSNAYTTAQYTPNKNIITAINVIDDLIYWTDSRNEPKKINVNNFIKGTKWSGSLNNQVLNSTRLYLPETDITYGYIEEANTTVIRPAPTTPPTIKAFNKSREGATTGTIKRRISTGLAHFALRQSDASAIFPLGPLPINLSPVNQNLNWKVGDTLNLVETTTQDGTVIASPKTAIIKLTSYVSNVENPYYTVELLSIDSTYTADRGAAFWKASLPELNTLYPKSFYSFAYRYKYTDNETSVISPFTKPIFIAGKYDYDPKEGFNLGMENQMKFLEIKDFIPKNIPKDVVEVELLYRDTNKANQVNSIRKIDINDAAWNLPGNGSNKGYVKIDAELFGPTIPSDQVDRNEDSVPTSAVSQEITESRLMYGNYTEAYDIIDNNGNKINVDLTSWLSPRPYVFQTSTSYSDNTFSVVQDSPINTEEDTAANTYNNIVRCNFEEEDAGNNYDNATYKYTVPVTGVYSFSATAKWYAKNSFTATSPSAQNNWDFWNLPQARLKLKKDTAGQPDVPSTELDFSQNATIVNPYAPADNASGTFQIKNALGSVSNQQPTWEPIDLSLQANNVYLTAGDVIYLYIEAKTTDPGPFAFSLGGTSVQPPTDAGSGSHIWTPPAGSGSSFDYAEVSSATLLCTQAPGTENSISITQGTESIKSMRNLDLGIVYRDAYSRQSTVLLDETLRLDVGKIEANKANNIAVQINNNAPKWAKYYKFFVKENTTTFHNLVMSAAFENNDNDADELHAWLLFNSVDIDKVKEEEYIILKKKHNSSVPVLNTDAKWKILEISENTPGGVESPILADESVAAGKFFAKIAKDSAFDTYFGTDFTVLGPNASGAVFETEPKRVIASDETSLYWEVGQAYPIKLNIQDAESYIAVGSRVEYYSSSYIDSPNTIDAITSQFEDVEVKVESVRGAYTFSKTQITSAADYVSAGSVNNPDQAYCVVTVGGDLININITAGNYVDLKFTKEDGSFVIGRAVASTQAENRIYLLPYTCPTIDYPNATLPKALPWYNCFMFGNGVESDTIRDDFNADTIFEYQPAGKTSGFKASIFYEDYKQETKKNDIIFSQIFNEKSNINRFNEFLLAKPIVKQLAPEYGSIQKLFTRDSDLLAFCENKVLQILANKNELFNADGTSQLVGESKVLGRARPFAGDYGISKNPESFASDEFRVYFTDKARGAVLRLSRDGMTNISDYGMKNWFYDNLANAQALIGSFDGKKNQYNIAVHSVTNPESKKDVYTLSFSESVNGWASFKGFIKEIGTTLNNFYYTFKEGKPWIHHSDSVNRNLFYNKQYDSSVQPIFNDASGSVKTFSTISYEGTQSKVTQNTDSRDSNYFNLSNQDGWYIKSITTDLQEGKVDEFINKEGKWFNNIIGETTTFTNAADAGSAAGNLDTRELSVQGLGTISANTTVVSGVINGFGFDVSLNIIDNDSWSID